MVFRRTVFNLKFCHVPFVDIASTMIRCNYRCQMQNSILYSKTRVSNVQNTPKNNEISSNQHKTIRCLCTKFDFKKHNWFYFKPSPMCDKSTGKVYSGMSLVYCPFESKQIININARNSVVFVIKIEFRYFALDELNVFTYTYTQTHAPTNELRNNFDCFVTIVCQVIVLQ